MTKTQGRFDFPFLDRKAVIDAAALPKASGKDGTGSSPAMMAIVLNRINEHLGDNEVSWPSQGRVADLANVSRRSVIRAAQALESLGLIEIIKRPKPGGGHKNYYRIIWEEIILLKKAKPRPVAVEFHSDVTSPCHGDVTTNHGDVTTNHGDVTTNHGDVTSHEQPTNNSKNNSKNNPPLRPNRVERRKRSTESPTVPSEWAVVVSVLVVLKMSAWESAIKAAIARGLKPADVLALAERLEPYRENVNPKANAGFLYRWITGASDPPAAEECKPTKEPHADYRERERTVRSLERLRYMAWKWGKENQQGEDAIAAKLREALVNRGYRPDEITLDNEPDLKRGDRFSNRLPENRRR